jgi:AcrR family transcriptional regulator
MENAQRKREILDVCLATFIRRGLYETSVRDLSRALALQSGGIYYWFKDKDDVVRYVEYVPEITNEPDYEKALAFVRELAK